MWREVSESTCLMEGIWFPCFDLQSNDLVDCPLQCLARHIPEPNGRGGLHVNYSLGRHPPDNDLLRQE